MDKKITKVESFQNKEPKKLEKSQSDVGFRVGGIVCWVVALACEFIAAFIALGKINWVFASTLVQIIIFLVADLVFLVVGSQLWKRANHINPASEKNKFAFALQNNLGSFMAVLCFVPVIIVILCSKNEKLDKKTKTIAVIVAAIALVIGGISGIDFNPVSSEQLQAAETAITQEVYWTQFGKVYHLDPECQALNRSDELFQGEVGAAIEHSKSRLCKFCAKKFNIENVATDEGK